MVVSDEDLKIMVVGGLLAGIALGWIAKMMYDVRKAKGAPRPFSGKQIQRWHLHPRDAEILTKHKDPQQRALDELEKLSETIDNGKDEFKKIRSELSKVISEISSESASIADAPTNAEKLARANVVMAGFVRDLANLRKDSEFNINSSINLAWRKHFLKLVRDGQTRDDIVSQMDGEQLKVQIKDPYTKNMNLIESEWAALTNDNADWTNELLTNLFGIDS